MKSSSTKSSGVFDLNPTTMAYCAMRTITLEKMFENFLGKQIKFGFGPATEVQKEPLKNIGEFSLHILFPFFS